MTNQFEYLILYFTINQNVHIFIKYLFFSFKDYCMYKFTIKIIKTYLLLSTLRKVNEQTKKQQKKQNKEKVTSSYTLSENQRVVPGKEPRRAQNMYTLLSSFSIYYLTCI